MRAAIRAVVALLLPWLAAACAGQTNQEFDMRLREMSGSNERSLLGGMGRIPDNSYQLDEDTKILQWRWGHVLHCRRLGADLPARRLGHVDADRRLSAHPGAPGLHRRMDDHQGQHPVLSLAGQRLQHGHHPRHPSAGLIDSQAD